MNRFSAAFQRIGGPGAVTWWAFGISTADRLLTVSVQPLNAAAPLSVRIVSTLVAQLAMFVPLVVLRYTLLKDPLKPRPWVALAGFSVADVVRAVAVDQLLHYWGGLPLVPELRVFSGFIPTLIPLLVTAYVVNTLRERRRELTALLAVREQLELARAQAESAVEQRNEELVDRVRSVMDDELATLSAQQPATVVEQLQRTATDVVRPLSHQLATSFAEREGSVQILPPPPAGWQQVLGEAFMDKPLRPVLTAVLLSGVWISAIAVFAPARWALIVTLILIPLASWLANLILRRLLPRMKPVARILAVFAASAVVGVGIGVVMFVLATPWPSALQISYAVSFYVTVVGAGMAVVSGVSASRTSLLKETERALEELRQQVLRTRQLQWYHQRALARALHGPVQSAVTAAALRMADASRDGSLTQTLVDSVHDDLVQVLDVLQIQHQEVSTLDASLDRIVGMWEGVCAVTTFVDEVAAGSIAYDPVMRACIIDVVTDAVSNAVRHGKAKSVSVTLIHNHGLIDISVMDDGAHGPLSESAGLGSALLNECATEWSLSTTAVGHTLRVQLPVNSLPARA